MYDDSTLQLSEFYFSIQQLLRIFAESINDVIADMNALEQGFRDEIWSYTTLNKRYSSRYQLQGPGKVIAMNWKILLDFHGKQGTALLQRIEQRIGDVESLRAGASSSLPTKLDFTRSTDSPNRYL